MYNKVAQRRRNHRLINDSMVAKAILRSTTKVESYNNVNAVMGWDNCTTLCCSSVRLFFLVSASINYTLAFQNCFVQLGESGLFFFWLCYVTMIDFCLNIWQWSWICTLVIPCSLALRNIQSVTQDRAPATR
jgi:hypothetical protein